MPTLGPVFSGLSTHCSAWSFCSHVENPLKVSLYARSNVLALIMYVLPRLAAVTGSSSIRPL